MCVCVESEAHSPSVFYPVCVCVCNPNECVFSVLCHSVVDAAAIERCVSELKTPTLLPGDEEDAKSQVCQAYEDPLHVHPTLFCRATVTGPFLPLRLQPHV